MKTTLIKLQNKFILVSDEEKIEESERCLFKKYYYINYSESSKTNVIDNVIGYKKNNVIYVTINNKEYISEGSINIYQKIISENPDFSLLSEEDCKTIGWVDVEKLADNEANKITFMEFNKRDKAIQHKYYSEGVIKGFKVAQFLNDKMFRLKGMKTLMYESIKFSEENQHLSIGEYAIKHYDWWNNKIQSLQQISWNVEVEKEYLSNDGAWKEVLLPSEWEVNTKTRTKITNNSIKVIKIL